MTSPGEDVPAWAIRLEAKVDVALTQHRADLDSLSRDLANAIAQRERDNAALFKAVEDLDKRTDTLERTPYVTTKGMAAAIGGTVTVVGGLLLIIDRLASLF